MLFAKTFLYLSIVLIVGIVGLRMLLSDEARKWLDFRFAVIIPIAAVGLFGHQLVLYFAAIFIAMVVLPRSRAEAAGFFIFLTLALPKAPFDLRAGSLLIGQIDGPLVAAAGLLLALRFPVARAVGRAGDRGITAAVALFIALLVVIDSRIAGTEATVVLRAVLIDTLTLGVPFWIVARSLNREPDLRRPLFYLVAVGFVLSFDAAFEMLRHWPMYQTIESSMHVSAGLSKTLTMRGGLMRAPGPFLESTTFGLLLALTTTATAAMRSLFRSQPAHLAAISIGVLGTFATLARNGWIGLLIGLFMIAAYRGRIGRAAGGAAFVLVAALIVILASPNSGRVADLLGTGETHAASTATYRQDLVKYSLPLIGQNPLIGAPIDLVRTELRDKLRSRQISVDWVNSYLYFTVATGLLGLAVFLVFILYPIYDLLSARSQLRNGTDLEVACALFGCEVAFAFMIFGTSFSERVPLFAMLLVAMSRLAVVAARNRRPALPSDSSPAARALPIIDMARPRPTPPATARQA